MPSPFDLLRNGQGGRGAYPRLSHSRRADPGPAIRQAERQQERDAAAVAPSYFRALKQQAFEKGFEAESEVVAQESKAMAAQQREQEKQAVAAQKAEQQQRNLANETKWRSQGRAIYKNELGDWTPLQDDDTWEAEKKKKADAAAQKARVKSGMESLQALSDGFKIAGHQVSSIADARQAAEAAAHAEKYRAADALKTASSALEATQTKHDADAKFPRENLPGAQRALSLADNEARASEAAVKKMTLEGPMAVNREQNMRRVIQTETLKIEQARRDLRAGKGVPWLDALSGAGTAAIAQESQGGSGVAAARQVRDAQSGVGAPMASAGSIPAPRSTDLPDEALNQRVQDADATLPKRQQDLQARQQQTHATVTKAEQDLAAAEQRLRTTPSTASGYSPVRLADGSEVDYAALKEHEAATEAHQRATEQAEREQEELQLETEAVNASLQQRNEAAQVLNDRAMAKRREQDAALDAQTGQLATRAGFAESATRLQQLDADFRKIRDRESDPNAIQAAFEEYQNHRQGILQEGHQKHEAATSEAMALLKKREARFAELKKSGAFSKGSPQANQQELEAEEGTLTYEIEGLAEKLGIMPEDAMGLYEDAGKLSAPWEDKLNKRAETSRRLSDGRVVVNPSLWADPDAYEKAVQDSQGTEDGKKQALAIMPELRRKAAEEIAKAVSVLPDFKQFLDEQPGSLEDKVAALIKEQKRGGALDQAINRMVGGGGSAIAQQALGTLAAMTGFVKDKTGVSLGSDALHRAMQWASDRGRAYETAAQLAATHPAINFGTELLQAGTSLLPAAAGGTAGHVIGGSTKAAVVGSAVAAGGQSLGGTYADAYQKTLQDALAKGAAPQDAERTARAESFTPAIASGILTSILTAGGGAKGVEAMFRSAAGRDVVKRTLAAKLREIGMDVAEESLEEGLDELGQGIIAQMTFDPNRSVVSIVEQSVKAAVMGGFLGGAVSTVKTVADGREPSAEAIAMEDAASRSVVDTELSDGTPEATQARVLLDIASGERSLDTLQNDELDAVGLKRDAKGEIKSGKDAVVSVENGKPIILQPALEARAAAKEQTPKDKAQDETATGQPPDVAADAPNDLGNSGAEQGGSGGTGATASSSEGGAIGVESVGEAPEAVAPETPDAPPMEQPTNPRVAPDEAEPGTVLSEPVKPSQGGVMGNRFEKTRGESAAAYIQSAISNDAPNAKVFTRRGANGDVVAAIDIIPRIKGGKVIPNELHINNIGSTQKGAGKEVFLDAAKYAISHNSSLSWGAAEGSTKFYKGLGLKDVHELPQMSTASVEELKQLVARDAKPAPFTAPTPEPEPANLTDRIQRLAKPSVIAATKQGQRQGADVGVQAKLIATAVEREAGKFAGVRFETLDEGEAGVRLAPDGTLILDVPKMMRTVSVKSVRAAREWIDAVMDEEFRHRVSIDLDASSPEWSQDLKDLYDALPDDLKEMSRAAYFAKADTKGSKRQFPDDFVARHEFFRQYWQNAEFAKLTESALNSKGLIDTLRKVVAAFIKELRRISKGANPQVKAVADRLIAMAEKRAGELSKAKAGKPVQPDILAGAGVTPPQSKPSAPTLKSGEGDGTGVENNAPVFTRDEITVSKPSVSRRKRPTGTDGESITEVKAPSKVTASENWHRLADTDKLDAHVEARLDFTTGKAPKKTDAAWTARGGRTTQRNAPIIAKGVTYDEAINAAKDFVQSANAPLSAAPSGPSSDEDAEALERLAAEANDELTPEQRKILEEFHNLPDADDETVTPDLKAKVEGGTSIKNAVMRAEREERGAEPLPRVIPRQWQTAGRNAQRVLDQEPEAASKLLKLLMADPRAITDNEVALILIYKVKVEQRMERASREMEKHPKDSPENIEAKQDYDHYADELNNIDIAGNLAGTETGRGLNARKMMKARDFSEAALMQAYRTEVRSGERLTEDEIKHVRKVAADIASVMAKIQADETAQLQKQAQAGLQRLTDELKKKPEKTSKVRRVLADRVKGARERLAAAFSLGAAPSGNAQDAEYLAAVERGDMETAQRMVDEAAKRAGFTRKGHHGTVEAFDAFDMRLGKTSGFGVPSAFFTSDEAIALDYSQSAATAKEARARRKQEAADILLERLANRTGTSRPRNDRDGPNLGWINSLDISDRLREKAYDALEAHQATASDEEFRREREGKTPRVIDAYLRLGNPLEVDANRLPGIHVIPENVRDAKRGGHDGLIVRNVKDGPFAETNDATATVTVVFSPSQIKSADPVTRDAQGNVIPLSQRFNPESKSILHAAPSGELSPEVLQDLATVGASYIEDGAKTVEDFTAAMVGEFGERVKPYVDSLFRVAQKQHADAAKEATEGAKPEAVLKKAQARLGDAPEGELDEALVVALATAYIRQKVSDAQEMVRRITADLKPLYPDVTEEMVRIVFSGYGKTSKPSEDALKKQIAEYKAQLRLVQGQEDVRRGQAPLKSGFQRGAQSATVRGLSQELQDLMRRYNIAHTAEDQLADARKAVVTRLRHQIEDLARIIDGKAKPRDPKAVVQYDDEMKALLKERNELKQYVDELTGPSPEVKWNQRAQAAARASEEHYRRKIAAGELTTKQGGTHTESPETVKARDDAKKAKREFEALREASGIPQAEALAKTKERLNEAVKEATERLVTGRKAVKGQKPKITDAEAQALEEKLRRLRASIRLVEGGKKWTDTQRAETAAKNIRRQIGNLSERIQANNTTKKPKGDPVPETDELRALKQERAFLWEIYAALEEAKHPRRLPAEIAVDAFRRRVDKLRRDAEAKLKGGEFLETPEEDRVFQKRIEAARFELSKLKENWARELFEKRMEARPTLRKILDMGAEVLNTARAILTSLDFSAVLNQGGFIAMGHPIRAIKGLPTMLRAFASEQQQHAAMEELKRRKNFPLYQQARLYLSDMGELDLSKMEETFMSRWAGKIPLVAGSQRAYLTFLNRLRADSFDAMVATLGRDGRVTKDEGRALASYINVATGRGIIGRADRPQGTPVLSTIFFAPRLVASRFNLLAGQPLYGGTGRTRALVAQEYGRFIAGTAIAMALAALAKDDDDQTPLIESDPRSTDFAKIRFGNTRIDFLTGMQQVATLLARVITGETKRGDGKVMALRGENVPFRGDTTLDILTRFLRSKLSPVVGTGVNIATGKDFKGDEVTARGEATKMLVPMSLQGIVDVMEDQGVPRGAALWIAQLMGVRMTTYESKKPAKVAQKPAARPPVRPVMPPRTGANIRTGDWQSRMRQMIAT